MCSIKIHVVLICTKVIFLGEAEHFVMPDPMTFSFFLKNIFYITLLFSVSSVGNRSSVHRSWEQEEFLRLSSEAILLLNGILPLCARTFNACIVCHSIQWGTPIVKGAQRTRTAPAVISCASWFVFSFLTVLRDEKQKEFAFRRVSLVLVTWFRTASRRLSQAPTARTTAGSHMYIVQFVRNWQYLSWRLYLCHNVVFVDIQFNVNLSVCYYVTEWWQP